MAEPLSLTHTELIHVLSSCMLSVSLLYYNNVVKRVAVLCRAEHWCGEKNVHVQSACCIDLKLCSWWRNKKNGECQWLLGVKWKNYAFCKRKGGNWLKHLGRLPNWSTIFILTSYSHIFCTHCFSANAGNLKPIVQVKKYRENNTMFTRFSYIFLSASHWHSNGAICKDISSKH